MPKNLAVLEGGCAATGPALRYEIAETCCFSLAIAQFEVLVVFASKPLQRAAAPSPGAFRRNAERREARMKGVVDSVDWSRQEELKCLQSV
jgi:hypothetical protein